MGKQKRVAAKAAMTAAEAQKAADDAAKAEANEDFDRTTRRMAAMAPMKAALFALAGTVVAALIAGAATIGAARLKDDKPATTPIAENSRPAVASASPKPSIGHATPGTIPHDDEALLAPDWTGTTVPDPAVGDIPQTATARPTATTSVPRPTTRTTTTAPARTGTKHDGPHRGTIGWGQYPFTVDVENAGFRGPDDARQGEISASPDGIRSAAGVRIARFRSSAANFSRCADLDYHSMGTLITASSIGTGDCLCANDGTQYLATYDVEIRPAGANTFYQLNGTSWFRPVS